MIGLEEAPSGRVKVTIPKVMRQFLVMLHHHVEVTLHQLKTFNYSICLVKACLREDQHHESVQQFFVLHELHVALSQLRGYVVDCSFVHLPEKYRQ